MSYTDTYVPGLGPLNPRIAIVGEAPSYEEVQAKQPFVGSSGRFLNDLLRQAGIKRDECWVSNVCKYMAPPNIGEQKIPFWTRASSIGINKE